MEALFVGVNNQFQQADDALMPWEGGYVFEDQVYDAYEIADAFAWVAGGEFADAVFEEMRDRLNPDKVYANRWWLALEPEKAYSSAWKEFCEYIKHRTRFVFWAARGGEEEYVGAGEVPVAKILESIGRLLERLGLVQVMPTRTLLYRSRGHEKVSDSESWTAADLGTNTAENSTGASRMSPAGIPLFYGADDVDTALAEVARVDKREFFTVAQFSTTTPIKFVNLVDVPDVPSIFDPKLGKWQGEISFLVALVKQLREPVESARASLDYIPTQVFCEYLLRVFGDRDIRGLAWGSVTASGGGRCVALDVPHGDCVDVADYSSDRPQLALVPNRIV